MNVDDLLPEAWHPADVAELDAWQFGDVVPTPRLFWAAPDGLDPVTGLESHTGASAWQVIAPKIPAPTPESLRWGVITTPTCNVSACGPGARCATVQVSPVVPLHDFTPSQIIAVTKHEMVDFVRLTNPPAPGEWAIDLRISLPVSKGVLLGHTPHRGFACESDEIELADHLAGRSRRPALHDELSGSMLKSLRALVKSSADLSSTTLNRYGYWSARDHAWPRPKCSSLSSRRPGSLPGTAPSGASGARPSASGSPSWESCCCLSCSAPSMS